MNNILINLLRKSVDYKRAYEIMPILFINKYRTGKFQKIFNQASMMAILLVFLKSPIVNIDFFFNQEKIRYGKQTINKVITQRGWEDCLIESGHLSLSLPSGILTVLGCLIHLLTCPNLKPERSGLFFWWLFWAKITRNGDIIDCFKMFGFALESSFLDCNLLLLDSG